MSEPGPTMRAAVIDGPGALVVRVVQRAVPGPGEVEVRIEYCGVCGTDLHTVMDGWAPPGTIVGHEWSGVVESVGSDVTRWEPGDRVVGGPPSCGRCEFCLVGRPSLCLADPLRSGTVGHDGAFAEYLVATADSLHRSPDGLDPRAAALSEPLAVALHGLTLARLPVDPSAMRILVSGAGPLGLLLIAALVDRGATDIVVAEPAEARRARALAAGARVAVVPGDLPTPPSMPTQPADPGFDAAFETSGRGAAIATAVGLLRPAGTLVLFGTGTMSVTIDPIRILFNELVVTGAYCYDATGIEDALELLATGRLPVDALLSPADVGLDELLDTMQRLRTGEHSRKAMVRPHA